VADAVATGMQVEVERLPEARARLRVTIPADDVTRATDRAFKRLVGRYEVPGFRRGKAPRAVFERYFGAGRLLQEAADQLIADRYVEATRQANVKPVGRPEFTVERLEPGGPLVFVAEVAVKPAIVLPDYQDLVNEPLVVPEVTEEALQQELARVAEAEAQLVVAAPDDPVAAGSRVVLSIRGTREGETEPFVEADEYPVEVGSGSVLEGLESQLIGLTLNQQATLHVTYPDDYADPTLAGQTVQFEVVVKEHKRREVPPIDDELARARGMADLQELRESLTNSLRERYEREAKEARLRSILDRLRERVTLEVPDVLVDRQVDHQLQDLHHTLTHLGADLDRYLVSRGMTLEALAAEMRPGATERVKDELLLEAIAEAEGLTVSDEEVVAALESVAQAYERPIHALVENLKVSGEFETVRGNLLVDKAAQLVREPRQNIA
jgi:trigger factor